MGTNYYLKPKATPVQCPTCGHVPTNVAHTIHIGKSSAGWCFALHVFPDKEGLPRSLEDWKAKFELPHFFIEDEYGAEISVEKMLHIIEDRRFSPDLSQPPPGYHSWEDLYEKNHAERGPHGLLRHRIKQGHCIGHGDGTWDLVVGEFS